MNPYEVLEVESDANDETIKKAYRKKAQQTHPDKNGGDDEPFKLVQKSYEVLSDPERRKLYDETGSTDELKSEAMLHTTFGNIFIELIGHDEAQGFDLMEMARRTAHHVQNESQKNIAALQSKVHKLSVARERVEFHGKGSNVLHVAIDRRIRDAEQQIAQSKRDLDFGHQLLALMEDYTYKAECKPEDKYRRDDEHYRDHLGSFQRLLDPWRKP